MACVKVQNRKTRGWALLILLGSSIPVLAQIDISGSWAPINHSTAGPDARPVDYLGIPFNASGVAKALAHSTSELSMPERVCAFFSPVYVMLGPFGLKLWNETEPRNGTTTAWKIAGWEDLAGFTIWMDGRPHPSQYAPHELSGFTTGVWEDDALTTYTTHMRAGITRRNGAPSSDRTTMTLHFFVHGDELTLTARVEDPVYLSEPFYLTRTFERIAMAPMKSVGSPCIQGNEGVAEGVVLHYLPGKNLFLDEMTKVYNIPAEAVLGGAETMYPEYRKRLKGKYVMPEECPVECGGPGLSDPTRVIRAIQ